MTEWIDVKDRLPDLKQPVLVVAKEGFSWPENGSEDERQIQTHVGYFYDANETWKSLEQKIEFIVDCGCSGIEHDRPYLEPIFWMPLPEAPRN